MDTDPRALKIYQQEIWNFFYDSLMDFIAMSFESTAQKNDV